MSYFEKFIPAFIRYGDKVTVDPSAAGSNLPVQDTMLNEFVEELLRQQKLTNQYFAIIIGEDLDEDNE